jgi:uncharacterized protein (DUF488 family)
MKLRRLITIGYEGADFKDFLATLKIENVTQLLDIRELPMSRRKGFSKTALREGLASIGIDYRHEPWLGSPRAIRHRLREDGDYARFFRAFARHLDRQTTLLNELAAELEGTVALLCYERDHRQCHRSIVAEVLGEITGLEPKHRGVQGHAQREKVARSRAHLGEGVPAT